MSKVLLGSALAAVVMFMFGFVFWGISGLPNNVMSGARDVEEARTYLKTNHPEDGFYKVPYSENWAADEAFAAQAKEGPLATIIIRHEGKDPGDMMGMAMGWVYQFVCIFLVALLLHMAMGNRAMTFYVRRVGFVIIAGLAISIYGNFGDVVWWSYPTAYPTLTAIYDALAWILAGLVLAALVKPKPHH